MFFCAQWLVLSAIGILTVFGCASFDPHVIEEVPFRERAQAKEEGNVRVTAAVPGAKETIALFGVNLYRRGIQPVWVEVENKDEEGVFFLPYGVDPNYFTPLEAAYLSHFLTSQAANQLMYQHFFEQDMRVYVGPGSVRSGFVLTNLDEGTKNFNVEVLGRDQQVRTYAFFISVPGLRLDHHSVDFEGLYSEHEVLNGDEAGVRKALESMPCCTTNKKGSENGDPLNLVVIGDIEELFYAFMRSGWDETETIYGSSAWKTVMSFLFGGRYRYSPVSGLYVYGRPQDIALQKARETIHERNHLRLWLAPLRFEGKSRFGSGRSVGISV
jgi:hypothetical protein